MNLILFLILINYIKPIILPLTVQKYIDEINENESIEMFHNLNFYYYIYLYIGKERKKQSYILDTGSIVTSSPCNLCKHCGKHQNGFYKIDKKNILKCKDKKCSLVKNKCKNPKTKCKFSIKYVEGSSINGVYINELIRFNYNDIPFKFPIGCTINETTAFKNQLPDGVLGIKYTKKSFISILYKLKIIKHNLFTLCFSNNGGFFSIGEIIYKSHLDDEISYIKLKNKNINIISILISNKVINVNKGRKKKYKTIIDSGTTFSSFPISIANKCFKIIKKICNKKKNKGKCGENYYDKSFGECFEFDNINDMYYAINNVFPNIIFKFENNISFVWEPKNYYIDIFENVICLGFIGLKNKFVLGINFIKGYNFIFNIKNSKIGFIKSNCDYFEEKTMNKIKMTKKKVKIIMNKMIKEIIKEIKNDL